ncbi:MAG TPA: hypothetical protein VGJ12_12800 [Gemmatimonadaceae bacterium]
MKMLRRAAHPRALVRLYLAALALVVGAACSGRDATSPPPPPQDQWIVAAERAWTIIGGAETYKCVGIHVTSDEYFTGFRLAGPSAEQREVLLTVSDSPVPEGPFDCGAGTDANRLIYAASLGTGAIEFPTGFGVHVSAGQYLLLNIHIVNLTGPDITDSTRLEARIGTATDVATPIDMTMAGTFLINIPSDGQVHTAGGACFALADTHVLAFLPLMRSRGVHQSVEVVSGSSHNLLFDQDFDWQHVSYTQLTTPALIHMGDKIDAICSYVNNGGQTETYGESSTNESCFSAIYRYPVSATSNFLSCANNLDGTFDVARE